MSGLASVGGKSYKLLKEIWRIRVFVQLCSNSEEYTAEHVHCKVEQDIPELQSAQVYVSGNGLDSSTLQ